MNTVTLIMLVFFLLGFLDYITGNHLHIGSGMEKGLGQLGNMAMSVIGFYVFSETIVANNIDAIKNFTSALPFDPSILTSMVLDVTMGGFSVANVIADSPEMVFFSGLLVASGVGCLVAFEIPVVFTCVEKENLGFIIKGIVAGIVTLPIGLIIGGLLGGVNILDLILNIIPILILCVVLVVGIMKAPMALQKILNVIGSILKAIAHGLTIFVFIRLFFPDAATPWLSWIPVDLAWGSLDMTVRMTIGMAGGMVITEGAIYYGKKQIQAVADLIGVNNYSVMGFVVSLVSPLAMFPFFGDMDTKGKLLNAAFSVMGAYVIGAQMSFVAQVTTASNLYIYMLTKVICGILAMIFINMMHKKGKM